MIGTQDQTRRSPGSGKTAGDWASHTVLSRDMTTITTTTSTILYLEDPGAGLACMLSSYLQRFQLSFSSHVGCVGVQMQDADGSERATRFFWSFQWASPSAHRFRNHMLVSENSPFFLLLLNSKPFSDLLYLT